MVVVVVVNRVFFFSWDWKSFAVPAVTLEKPGTREAGFLSLFFSTQQMAGLDEGRKVLISNTHPPIPQRYITKSIKTPGNGTTGRAGPLRGYGKEFFRRFVRMDVYVCM